MNIYKTINDNTFHLAQLSKFPIGIPVIITNSEYVPKLRPNVGHVIGFTNDETTNGDGINIIVQTAAEGKRRNVSPNDLILLSDL